MTSARAMPWHRWLLAAALTAIATTTIAEDVAPDATYWRRQEEGWFWYRDPPSARPSKSTTPRVTAKPAATRPEIIAHAALKAQLEQALAVAYMNPTEVNVRTYLALQTQAVRRASTFADAWQKVVWATPEFDFTLERPVNAAALEVYDRERQAAQRRAVEALARTHVLFFLFRSDCPYCQQFAPLLRNFAQKFGLPVFAISLDGGALPEFPRARVDNGIAATLNVTQVPALFLASPRTHVVTPIGYGVLSESELLDRLQVVATPPGSTATPPAPPVDLAGAH
jgi:conjugal transfer pilus assembly protein TraF